MNYTEEHGGTTNNIGRTTNFTGSPLYAVDYVLDYVLDKKYTIVVKATDADEALDVARKKLCGFFPSAAIQGKARRATERDIVEAG